MYFDDNNDEKRKICVYDRELEFAQRKLLNREGRGGEKPILNILHILSVFSLFSYVNIIIYRRQDNKYCFP